MLRRDAATTYPVPYRVHRPDGVEELLAAPVPGTDAGPWLKGTAEQHATWRRIFGRGAYRARKGVTTDLNGAFFVNAELRGETATIRNDPALGRKPLPRVTAEVEAEHVFPLLRGRDLGGPPQMHVLVPQRGMHGDPDLAETAPLTHAYLERFRPALERRSSLRRYQPGRPYWSLERRPATSARTRSSGGRSPAASRPPTSAPRSWSATTSSTSSRATARARRATSPAC